MRAVYRLLWTQSADALAPRQISRRRAPRTVVGMRHLVVRFDPVQACNLPLHHVLFLGRRLRPPPWLAGSPRDEIETARRRSVSARLSGRGGCGAEPTMYKGFPELVRLARQHGVPDMSAWSAIGLPPHRTEHVGKLIDYGLEEIMISAHGVTRQSYERYHGERRRSKRFHAALAHESTRSRAAAARARRNWRIPITRSMSDNLDELRGFFDAFGSYRISTCSPPGDGHRRPIPQLLLAGADIERFRAVAAELGATCKASAAITLLSATPATPGYVGEPGCEPRARRVPPCYGRADRSLGRPGTFDWRNESYAGRPASGSAGPAICCAPAAHPEGPPCKRPGPARQIRRPLRGAVL